IAQMKYKPQPRFLAGFLVPEPQARGSPLVGRLFPQPRVETEDGEDMLLDGVLGHGFSLLALTSQPARLRVHHTATLGSFADAARGHSATWHRLEHRTGHRRGSRPGASPHEAQSRLWRLRPDRYVAACLSIERSAEACNLVTTLLQKAGRAAEQGASCSFFSFPGHASAG